MHSYRLSTECTTCIIQQLPSLATEKLSAEQTKLETCREFFFARDTMNFSVFTRVMICLSCSDLLQICIIVFNISIFMHEICSDRVDLKDCCNYLWLLFTRKAERMTRRVRFQCGRPRDHLLITHPPLLSVERPALSVGKHSVSPALYWWIDSVLHWALLIIMTVSLLHCAQQNYIQNDAALSANHGRNFPLNFVSMRWTKLIHWHTVPETLLYYASLYCSAKICCKEFWIVYQNNYSLQYIIIPAKFEVNAD